MSKEKHEELIAALDNHWVMRSRCVGRSVAVSALICLALCFVGDTSADEGGRGVIGKGNTDEMGENERAMVYEEAPPCGVTPLAMCAPPAVRRACLDA